MSITVLDVLRATREYAADPAHIVTNPHAIYETADGVNADFPDRAARGCILGCQGIVVHNLGIDPHSYLNRDSMDVLAEAGLLSEAMDAGHEAILAHIDRAIASAEAQA